MRGTYAKINLIRNKLRSMGQKDPIVMLSALDGDEDDNADKVKEERTAADPGAPARMGRGVPTPKKQGPKTEEQAPETTKGQGPKTEKPRYNPFKDGRTPTSASQTTGP